MPYKLKDGLPSSRANTVELTDFIELECLRKADLTFSGLDIIKTLDTGDDYQENEIDESNLSRDNIEEPRVDDAMNEIETRLSFCSGKYPFIIDGNKVSYNSIDTQTNLIYIYLLLATRLHMGGKHVEKVLNGIDGTQLFERLCEKTLESYWGTRSRVTLFGTAAGNRFEGKINSLIGDLQEGIAFKNSDANTPTENDGLLDVAVWKPFTDERRSKLIGFAQCKTGDNWYPELRKLDPSTFVDTWFQESTALTPVNTFMISDIARDYFFKISMNFLFFDRCRIMDFLPADIDDVLLDNICTWVIGALTKYEIDHSKLGIEPLD
jgi:hypothetical protein